jgi:hypothetical protein
MQDTTARTIATIAIWGALAVIFSCGIFHFSWSGDGALLVLLLTVFIVCAAATISTACVWSRGRRPARLSEQRGFEPLPLSSV